MNTVAFRTLVWREIKRFLVVFKQTLIPPVISALLFIIIFGLSLGDKIEKVNGVPYVEFLIPGLVMMSLIDSAFANTSSSLFLSRWASNIQEVLISPLSFMEMVLALLIGSVARSLLVAVSVYAAAMLISPMPVAHPLIAFYFLFFVSVIFSLVGMIVALFADEWENLSTWSTFVITPLIFFGGVFHSVTQSPDMIKKVTLANPLFYMIDGLRYGVLGVGESPLAACLLLVLALAAGFFFWTVHLFKIGYRLRS